MKLLLQAILSGLIFSAYSNITFAKIINDTLLCIVVETEEITVGTRSINDVSVKKQKSEIETKVILSPFVSDSIHVVWSPDTSSENKYIYRLGYSKDNSTQYIGIKGDSVITYMGKNDDGLHVLIRFDTLERQDGGREDGWRIQEYYNYILHCK